MALGQAREALDALRAARDEGEFTDRFNAFIGAAQAVLISLLREGHGERPSGFTQWYARRRDEMDRDDVMVMVREARDLDFHDGAHQLRFKAAAGQPAADSERERPGTSAWWRLANDSPLHVALDNAPRAHLGRRLRRTDPVFLAEVVYDYVATLVGEAGGVAGAASRGSSGA